jgi:hypothetical protein
MVTKLLSKTFIEKLKTQVFILSAEKLKEKWQIFERRFFAAYIINHVIYLATAKIRKITLSGENKLILTEMSH